MSKNSTLKKAYAFFKKEFVLCIAILCAVISLFFVEYNPKVFASYIDWKSLAMLLSLMLVSEGFKSNGVFDMVARKLTGGSNIKVLVVSLTMMPLIAAMFITNDVALITFVPLAIAALTMANRKDLIIRVVIVQTLAANLGATITPIGDPHNLYVFVKYAPSIVDWFKATLPYLPMAALIVFIPSVVGVKNTKLDMDMTPDTSIDEISGGNKTTSKRIKITNAIYAVLFVVTFLAVLGLIDYRIVVILVMAVVSAIDYKNARKVDWYLLLTFVAFFIFSGNLQSIPSIKELLQNLAKDHTFEASVVASQVISNVPATIILAPFTDNWKELTIGCDVGAFGTPIASLANLIAIKIYLKSEDAKPGKYMLQFTIAEVIVLAVLCVFASFVTL